MKTNFFKLFLIIFVIFTISGCTGKNSHYEYINYDEYKSLIENNESFVLEIMKTGCSACEAFEPKLDDFLKKYNLTIKVINTDNLKDSEYNELKRITSLEGTPTIIFYKDGKETSVATRIVGNVTSSKIVDKFKDNGIIK